MKALQAESIDAYIEQFPADVQKKLLQMRVAIRKAAPKAEEAMKYAIPTYVQEGNLVHFAAFKNHIGFYPAPRALVEFKKDLSAYKGSKGTVQFPLDEPLPLALIKRIVKFRIKENVERAKAKSKKK